jgi:hypothetical protein
MMTLAMIVLILALLPAALGMLNLRDLSTLPTPAEAPGDLVSILIPARDEADRLETTLRAARASRGMPVEILVMDDGSTDGTAALVERHSAQDPRVRLATAGPLPPGWKGKNSACQQLADRASGSWLLFVDADVTLAPHAAAALTAHARAHGVSLASAVPRQHMRSLGELLTVPMINLLLIGYLPLRRMRAGTDPSLGAACGQLLLVERGAYVAAGGHAAVRGAIHEALALVRRMRAAGFRTDLVAGDSLASCRMYESFGTAWDGFLKNAHEGMATPKALPVWTVLLLGGHVMPPILLLATSGTGLPAMLAGLAVIASLGLRLAVTLRARESLWSVPLHPLTVLTALAIQWTALVRARQRRPMAWKGRTYLPGSSP